MRTLITCLVSFLLLKCSAQQPSTAALDITGEFKVNSNGLIYSPEDVKALKYIVDSLNLQFKTCDLSKPYLAYPQAHAAYIRFESKTNELKDVKHDIDKGLSVEELMKKYRHFIKFYDSSKLIIKTPSKNDNGSDEILTGNANGGFDNEYLLTKNLSKKTKERVYEYEPKDKYTNYYSISCWFIKSQFTQNTIPQKYAMLIQYVDCMIDTAASIFTGGNKEEGFGIEDATPVKQNYNDVNMYLNKKMGKQKKKDDYSFNYIDAEKISYAKNNLSNDELIKGKVTALAESYLTNETGADDTEELIAFFVSKQKALEIKRKRRVFGRCSMDNSPRVHAKNIASLAAETHSWDIFLRAHLNIMNDRFERMSDGSWAWGTRQTYIKELETLNINVLDLMFGLSLRAYNNAENHYNGTVWRIGKALAESKDRQLFETKALEMIKDKGLDEFNRSLIFLLYHSYLNFLSDKKETTKKINTLKQTKMEYPDFIQTAISKISDKSAD